MGQPCYKTAPGRRGATRGARWLFFLVGAVRLTSPIFTSPLHKTTTLPSRGPSSLVWVGPVGVYCTVPSGRRPCAWGRANAPGTSENQANLDFWSPRAALWSPRTALWGPRAALWSPRAALWSRRTSLSSPRTAHWGPRTALWSPRAALRSPRTALWGPRTSLSSPRTVLWSPRTALWSPRAALWTPRTALWSPRRAHATKAASKLQNASKTAARMVRRQEPTRAVVALACPRFFLMSQVMIHSE